MSRLDREPRSRKSPMNRPINRDQGRQRYRDVMRKEKWNGNLRSLLTVRVDAGLGLGKMPDLRFNRIEQLTFRACLKSHLIRLGLT